MKLEDQVISIPQAMRLNELGILQESLFYHTQDKSPTNINLHLYGYRQVNMPFRTAYGKQSKLSTANVHFEFSAFTVAELGEMLPKSLGLNDGHHWAFYHRHCWKGESVGYSAHGVPSIEQDWFVTEAEARATMLIGLLENALITAEECNKRLTSK